MKPGVSLLGCLFRNRSSFGLALLAALSFAGACAGDREAGASSDAGAVEGSFGGESAASVGGRGGAGAASVAGRPAAGRGGSRRAGAGAAAGGGVAGSRNSTAANGGVGGSSGAGGKTTPAAGSGDAGKGGGQSGSAGGAAGAGDEPTASPGGKGTPPQTWKEHWFEHDRTLQLVASNDWVALYFDDDVDRNQTTWILPFLTKVWQYTVQHYGTFTDGERDGRLYAIYHQGRYSGGHPSTYFDASHDFRNVSDVGPGPFPDGTFAISTHEVSHVVEGASRGVHGSPAFGLWGDSKWAEFYQYDLYVALGETNEAERVLREFSDKSDSFPRAGTHWFRDWFYPLWRDHGHVEVMANYFRLLSQHYKKRGESYDGDMNWGEYIHFMSGAAHTTLKAQATSAFGWSDEREAEFVAAQSKYPGVSY